MDWSLFNRPAPSYDADYLTVWHKTVDFLKDPKFRSAYHRGMNSGHKILREPGSATDIHIEWRVHVILWAAQHAARLPGDFVECGVNTGILSLAVCEYLDFNSIGKSFYLFDTFAGIPPEQITEREKALGRIGENEAYFEECYEVTRRNFASYPKARLVRGKIPETLPSVSIPQLCYLSLDLNIVEPEIAALEFFWEEVVPGCTGDPGRLRLVWLRATEGGDGSVCRPSKGFDPELADWPRIVA